MNGAIKFNKINKVILFGGSRLLGELSQKLNKVDMELVVFSSKRHLEESINKDNEILSDLLSKEGIKFYESEDINKDNNLKNEITENTLGIGIGEPWVFEKEIVDLFEKHYLLDFMGIDLPKYRGGAHYTWQILHNNHKGCANIQIIYGGKDTFHKGEIVERKEYNLPKEVNKPVDYFDFMVSVELNFLMDFLNEVKQGKEFPLLELNEGSSSYYPFLHTNTNGFINWNWSGKDIAKFINAFDEPYNGASTYVDSKKVHLKDCMFLEAEEPYHPFTSGIVVRKNADGLFVAIVGNLLNIKKVLNESGDDITPSIKLGQRFYTPFSTLDKSMGFRAVYDSRGLKEVGNE